MHCCDLRLVCLNLYRKINGIYLIDLILNWEFGDRLVIILIIKLIDEMSSLGDRYPNILENLLCRHALARVNTSNFFNAIYIAILRLVIPNPFVKTPL